MEYIALAFCNCDNLFLFALGEDDHRGDTDKHQSTRGYACSVFGHDHSMSGHDLGVYLCAGMGASGGMDWHAPKALHAIAASDSVSCSIARQFILPDGFYADH